MTLSLFSLNMGHVSVSHTCIGLNTQVNKALKGGNSIYSLRASNSELQIIGQENDFLQIHFWPDIDGHCLVRHYFAQMKFR